MAAKAILNGHLSIVGSKHLSSAVKARILGAPDGKVRMFSTTLFDADGNPVVLQGRVRLSGKDGAEERGLTCSITVQNLDVTSFVRDENEKGKKSEMSAAEKKKMAENLL